MPIAPSMTDDTMFDPMPAQLRPRPMAGNPVPMADAGVAAQAPVDEAQALPDTPRQAPHTTEQPELMKLDKTGLDQHAMQAEGQARHQAKLADFGDQKNAIAMQQSALSVDDPNFANKLQFLNAKHGQVKEAEAQYKMDHPWGSMESAHPGFMGKVGHAFGMIGNVAGEAVAPGLAEAIPGSQLNLQEAEQQGQAEQGRAMKGITEAAAANLTGQKAVTEAAKPALMGAQTEHTQAETGKTEAQTNAIELATGHTVHKLPDGSLVQVNTDPDTGNTSAKLLYKGDPKRPTEVKQLQVAGKPHQVLFDKQTGEQIKDLGEAPPPGGANADKGATMIVPNAQGSGDAIRVTPGTKNIPLGAQTASGFGELGRPTQQQRNAAGRATNAVEAIPGIINEINNLEPKIGPIAGRWNDFMQGKVGMEDSDFAGLHQDLMMLSSAVALAHAVGRLPENLRLEFDHAINAPKQDPKNLVAVLSKVNTWMGRMRDQGIDPFTRAAEASGNKAVPGGAQNTSVSTGGGFADWKAKQGK